MIALGCVTHHILGCLHENVVYLIVCMLYLIYLMSNWRLLWKKCCIFLTYNLQNLASRSFWMINATMTNGRWTWWIRSIYFVEQYTWTSSLSRIKIFLFINGTAFYGQYWLPNTKPCAFPLSDWRNKKLERIQNVIGQIKQSQTKCSQYCFMCIYLYLKDH